MSGRQQNSTSYPINFFMPLTSDGKTGATGKAGVMAVTLSKNGAAPAAAVGAITEIGGGLYSLAGNATDRNTLGELWINASAAGCDTQLFSIDIVAGDPFAAGAGSDPLGNAVPGSYGIGTAGAALGLLAGINNKTINLPVDPADASDLAALFGALTTLLSTTGVVLTGTERSAIVAAFQATADWQKMLANVDGAFVFTPPVNYPGTGTLVLKNKANNVTLATITLTFDGNQVITGRSVV